MTESHKAAVERLKANPLATQTRKVQNQEKRWVDAELKEKLKDAEAALQNHMLSAIERKYKALEHIDIMDGMIADYAPEFRAYLKTSAQAETDESNNLSIGPDGERKFQPKSLGNTIKLRAEILELFGRIIEKREDVLARAAEMPKTITINLTVNTPDGEGDKPKVVDAETYNAEEDFKDI